MTDTPRDYVDKTRRRDNIVGERSSRDLDTSATDRYAYKYFSGFLDDREELLEDYQKTLKSAHITDGSDLYLSKVILYGVLTAIGTFLLTLTMSLLLYLSGYISYFASSDPLQVFITAFLPIFSTIILSSIVSGLVYIYPSYKSSRRASEIDTTLPSAITFMYALNRGGMNLMESMRVLSQNEEVYGEVSTEVGTIIQDMDYFSRDLMEALRRAGDRSPSQKFTDFMDDTVSTIDAGASTAPFLKDKSEELLEEAERDQSNFLETLSLLGEVYVTAFVAGPLFMIVITVIMSLMGGTSSTQLDGIVYGLLPFMNIGYFYLINVLSGSSPSTSTKIEFNEESDGKSGLDVQKYAEENDDEKVEKVLEAKKKRQRTKILRAPITELLNKPDKTLYFTVPIAIIYLISAIAIGLSEPSFDSFIDSPVSQTVFSVLIPIFIISVPLSIFYEISSYREKKILSRFPDALKTLENGNNVGMTLTEALDNTAEGQTGRLGDELKRVKNDIKWNHNVNMALIKFANRIRVPIVTKTMKLITEANDSTGNIAEVVGIAAKNVETQVRLAKERSQEMIMYTVVIIISFCVYLLVIAILDSMFLSNISDLGGQEFSNSQSQDGGSGFSVSDLPVKRFKLVFYHSTIIQAFGSGMIAGYLASENIRSGIKFAVVLSLIASLMFYVL